MRSPITQNHTLDHNGKPAGGTTFGAGFAIGWQNGPLGRGEERIPQNGAFVEDIIQAAIGRIHFYQTNGFACGENAEALVHLHKAAAALDERTKRREAAGVEGTHTLAAGDTTKES